MARWRSSADKSPSRHASRRTPRRAAKWRFAVAGLNRSARTDSKCLGVLVPEVVPGKLVDPDSAVGEEPGHRFQGGFLGSAGSRCQASQIDGHRVLGRVTHRDRNEVLGPPYVLKIGH